MLWLSAALLLAALAHVLTPLQPLAALERSNSATFWLVLAEIRLPRTLLALTYGAVLGMTGAALQALFANPLASPDVTGSSSGAALGGVVGGYWLGISSPLLLAGCAALGAALSLVLLFLLAGARASTQTLLLAGLAISFLAGASTSLLLAVAPSPYAFYDAFDWLMGSLVDKSSVQAATTLIPAIFCLILLLRRARTLDLLALGEEVMASFGHDPRRLATEIILVSSLAVGACVSVCGAIGFVGLISPYLARQLTRGHPGRALAPAAIIGGIVLLLADTAVRFAPPGRTLPVGVLTTIAGAPLFLFAVISTRRAERI